MPTLRASLPAWLRPGPIRPRAPTLRGWLPPCPRGEVQAGGRDGKRREGRGEEEREGEEGKEELLPPPWWTWRGEASTRVFLITINLNLITGGRNAARVPQSSPGLAGFHGAEGLRQRTAELAAPLDPGVTQAQQPARGSANVLGLRSPTSSSGTSRQCGRVGRVGTQLLPRDSCGCWRVREGAGGLAAAGPWVEGDDAHPHQEGCRAGRDPEQWGQMDRQGHHGDGTVWDTPRHPLARHSPSLSSQELVVVRGSLVVVLPVADDGGQAFAHQRFGDVAAGEKSRGGGSAPAGGGWRGPSAPAPFTAGPCMSHPQPGSPVNRDFWARTRGPYVSGGHHGGASPGSTPKPPKSRGVSTPRTWEPP